MPFGACASSAFMQGGGVAEGQSQWLCSPSVLPLYIIHNHDDNR